MRGILKRIALSIGLLIAAAAILLLTDRHSRQGARRPAAGTPIPVALLKHASNPLLDDVEQGVLQMLASRGFTPERMDLRRFSAEGDLPTANAIAKQITDGRYRLVISISTLSLQAVAHANKEGRAIHVFAAVTDPASAGVGIAQMNSTNKPRHLAGIGTFQPVEQILREAKKLWPDLKTVGVVWNPVERNSEVCTIKARQACKALGMELIEANVDSSKDVREAAESLVARGAQAFWTGADVTVMTATATLCEVARKARIPVCSNTSGHVLHGALFDLGANYVEVGEAMGRIVADILEGADPAKIPVVNFMPERVMLNEQVLKNLKDPWRFTAEMIDRAAVIIGEDGQVKKGKAHVQGSAPASVPQAEPAALSKFWRIHLVTYNESPAVEDATRGLRDGLKQSGLIQGQAYSLKSLCAQGDMAALGSLFDAALGAGTDLFVVMSTPTLQIALKKVSQTPIVFTVVADPIVAGAGKSDADHLPNVAGVYTLGPFAEMADLLKTHFPRIRRVGTLFCPSEANAVANLDVFTREAAKGGILVEAVPAL
jgi:ABC-type uncharacterized transport system substrate-binding protein